MSMNRTDYGLKYDVEVDSQKPLTITLGDPNTGGALNMGDTTQYNSGVVKIIKPDGTIIANVVITFDDRPNGVVGFTILDVDTVLANAGNWTGNLEISSDAPKIITQLKFNYNIIESY